MIIMSSTINLTLLVILLVPCCSITNSRKDAMDNEQRTMIVDSIENAGQYIGMHPSFKQAFDYLTQTKLNDLPLGRVEIDENRIYGLVVKTKGKRKEKANLESHRKYIDIQYVLSGIDTMGWKPTSACINPNVKYDDEKDIGFFDDKPAIWKSVHAGYFAIFFPEDAHAPMVSDDEIHKIVLKIMIHDENTDQDNKK